MQQFVVPQFIDIEDKIIGPITTRQFVLMMGGGFLIFICYKLADFALFLLIAIIIAGVVAVLAFLRINGRPFHFFLLNIIQTSTRARLRVWSKEITSGEARKKVKEVEISPVEQKKGAPKEGLFADTSRLAELSLMVDTGGAYGGE